MKQTAIYIISIATYSLLTACAVDKDRTDVGFGLAYHSKVIEGVDGSYIASVEASLARGRVGGAIELAMDDANKKCAELNKNVKVVRTDADSNFLVNGVARLTFKCE
jgi:hypothetical protein